MSALIFGSIPAPTQHKPKARPRAPTRPRVMPEDIPDVVTYAPKTRKSTLALVAGVAALHAVGILALANGKLRVAATPAAVPITIIMTPTKPAPPPEPEPAAPKPKVVVPVLAVAPPPPRIAVAATPVAQSPLASVSSAPPEPAPAAVAVAEPPAPPPAPEEPVTEPKGYAGYLRNPAPEYPVAAQKRGLEGKVVLKVHVLASGQPDSVTVAASSGHQILDEAALKAVLQWAFAPARRGQTAIDGWVHVPLNFRI